MFDAEGNEVCRRCGGIVTANAPSIAEPPDPYAADLAALRAASGAPTPTADPDPDLGPRDQPFGMPPDPYEASLKALRTAEGLE